MGGGTAVDSLLVQKSGEDINDPQVRLLLGSDLGKGTNAEWEQMDADVGITTLGSP